MEKNGNSSCLSFLSPSFQTQQKVNLLVSISLFSDNTKLKLEYIQALLKDGSIQNASNLILSEYQENPENEELIQIIISMLKNSIDSLKASMRHTQDGVNVQSSNDPSLNTFISLCSTGKWSEEVKKRLYMSCINLFLQRNEIEDAFYLCVLLTQYENDWVELWMKTTEICISCLYNSSINASIYRQYLINQCASNVITIGVNSQSAKLSIFPVIMKETISTHFSTSPVNWNVIFQLLYKISETSSIFSEQFSVISIESPHYLEIEKTLSYINHIKLIKESTSKDSSTIFNSLLIDYILFSIHCYFLYYYFDLMISKEKSILMINDRFTSTSQSQTQMITKKRKTLDDPFPTWVPSHSFHNSKYSNYTYLLLIPYLCFHNNDSTLSEKTDDAMNIDNQHNHNSNNNNNTDQKSTSIGNQVQQLFEEIKRMKYQWMEFSTAEMYSFSGDFHHAHQQYQAIVADYTNNSSVFSQSYGSLYKYHLTLRFGNCSFCLGSEQQAVLHLYSLLLSLPYPKRDKNSLQLIQLTEDLEQKRIHYFGLSEETTGFHCTLFLLRYYFQLEKFGEMLVLCQYGWPHFRGVFENLVKSEAFRTFQFPEFLTFVVNVDILEMFHHFLLQPHFVDYPHFRILPSSQQIPLSTQKELLERHVSTLYAPEKSIDAVLTNFFRTQISVSVQNSL